MLSDAEALAAQPILAAAKRALEERFPVQAHGQDLEAALRLLNVRELEELDRFDSVGTVWYSSFLRFQGLQHTKTLTLKPKNLNPKPKTLKTAKRGAGQQLAARRAPLAAPGEGPAWHPLGSLVEFSSGGSRGCARSSGRRHLFCRWWV